MSYRAQLKLAESFLAERLGGDWRKKLKEMSREEKEKLALELMDRGVRNAFALVKALGISSQTLRRLLEGRREAQGAGPLEEEADRRAAEALRAAKEDARRPILTKEIEDAAWFHNLLHDLGKYVFHRVVRHVEWTAECMRDPERAFETIAKFLDNLFEVGVEKAKALEELKVENKALDAYLTFATDLLEKAKERLVEYSRFTELAARIVCPRCRLKLMAQLIADQAAGGARRAGGLAQPLGALGLN
jgi:hypothetical protein